MERGVLALVILAAMLVVAGVGAAGVRTMILDPEVLAEDLAPFHKEPRLAEDMARMVTDDLVDRDVATRREGPTVADGLSTIIVSDRFEDSWRTTVKSVHSAAFLGDQARSLPLTIMIPGVRLLLDDEHQEVDDIIARSSLEAPRQAYAAELRRVGYAANLAVLRLLPLSLVVLLVALSRTRVRQRALTAFAAWVSAGAATVLVLAPVLASVLTSTVISADVRELATLAAPLYVSTARVNLAGLLVVAIAVMFAARIEESRVTRFSGFSRRGRER